MTRMLEALRRIEARSPQALPHPDTAPPETTVPEQSCPEQPRPACATLADEPPAAPMAEEPAKDRAGALGALADKILAQIPADASAVLMFTSPHEGAGKSDFLVPLAAELVERVEGEILLLDANLREPDLARRLGVRAARGLADVLSGAATWQEVVRQTSVPRLGVLPGVRLPDPNGVVPQRSDLASLLRDLRARYRLVLIDTASLAHAEVARMARHCDGTYLVVRLQHTVRRAIAEAAGALQRSGGRLLGCVVLLS